MSHHRRCVKGAMLLHADSLLEPDDVTFSVLVRGYGETEPPQWLAISGLLSMMSRKYEVQPNTGESVTVYRSARSPFPHAAVYSLIKGRVSIKLAASH